MKCEYSIDESIKFERLEGNNEYDKERGTIVVSLRHVDGNWSHYYIPPNIWASAVLTMSHFSERPNDWQAFMAHHQGTTDMLGAAKQVASIKNILAN